MSTGGESSGGGPRHGLRDLGPTAWAIIGGMAAVVIGLVIALAVSLSGSDDNPSTVASGRRHSSTTSSTTTADAAGIPATGSQSSGAGAAGSSAPSTTSGAGSTSGTGTPSTTVPPTTTTTSPTTTTTSPTAAAIIGFDVPATARCGDTTGVTTAVLRISAIRTNQMILRYGLDSVVVISPVPGTFSGTRTVSLACGSQSVTIKLTANSAVSGEPAASAERTITILRTGVAGG